MEMETKIYESSNLSEVKIAQNTSLLMHKTWQQSETTLFHKFHKFPKNHTTQNGSLAETEKSGITGHQKTPKKDGESSEGL